MSDPKNPSSIEPADLQKLQQEQDPLIIDVRSLEEFQAGHVKGALHIPIDQLESKLSELPSDRTIVPYCNMFHPGQSRGEKARDQLQAFGLDAQVLQGGFPAWRDANLPTETDPE